MRKRHKFRILATEKATNFRDRGFQHKKVLKGLVINTKQTQTALEKYFLSQLKIKTERPKIIN